ncbi:MAG: glycoside hydrolase family 2 TIM barrel-domain containing protein, partial [Pyrinomonadaceae bacterium]
TAKIKARWLDAKTGNLFAETKPQTIQLNSDKSTATLEVNNLQPKLWTPADPNLYKLEITLEDEDGKRLDDFAQNVGFRTFEARGNKLFLNGKPYWLRGTNQLPYGKNPWDAKLARKLIQYLHDNNQRITRTHATPWNEAWLDAADEIGLGVSIEGIRPWAFVGKIGATPPDLFEYWLMENADVVKRIRNHPSVLIWTIGNEMLLRDNENAEKWKQLSEVVKQTRALDATRPTVVSSSYVRETDLYNKVIKPNNIDDGDLDDVHSYRGWYAESPFVSDSHFTKERKDANFNRPFIGQEISTGYPDLDTGLPTFSYTKNQRSPQAWVGIYAYPGSDPKYFLEHQKIVTKRLAEQLRFQRGDDTSGFLLFSAECWFHHSYDAETVKPYPVLDYTKYAFTPVGLALETAQRKFFADSEIKTSVFVTNDDEQFRDYKNLTLEISFLDANGKQISSAKSGDLASLKYYENAKIPTAFKIPAVNNERTKMTILTKLSDGKTEVSRTIDDIEVFPKPQAQQKLPITVAAISLGAEMSKLATEKFQKVSSDTANNPVILVGKDAPLDELKQGGKLYNAARNGATVVVFSPGKKIQDLFPNDVSAVKNVNGEFADWTPASGTKLVENLQPMDLKWWARTNDWRAMVASESHKLNPNGAARELIRFIPSHGYVALDKIADYLQTVLFEIPVGKGRIWVCDLDLEASVSVDPTARIFAGNLLNAANDPNSTKNLIRMPTHEEMLAGKRPQVK